MAPAANANGFGDRGDANANAKPMLRKARLTSPKSNRAAGAAWSANVLVIKDGEGTARSKFLQALY